MLLLLSSKAIFVVGTRFHLVRASATFCVAIASHGDFHQKELIFVVHATDVKMRIAAWEMLLEHVVFTVAMCMSRR